MGRCCVCGREASNLVNGLWWCDKHVDFTQGDPKKTEPKTDKKGFQIDLGLAWI